MTPAKIIARAVAYHKTREQRWHNELKQSELETFWLAVFRLRDGLSVVEVEREFSRPDRGVTDQPEHFDCGWALSGGKALPRRRMLNARVVPRLSPMEADRLKRQFWIDQHSAPRGLP